MKGPLQVLEDLVRIESPSGREERAVEYLRELLAAAGIRPVVHGRNIWAVREAGAPGPTLLLNSHLDTVPATPAWTRPPFGAVTEGGKLYGLGVSDAKACVVGLLFAFLEARVTRGRVVFAATCDEETGGEGLEVLAPHLPEPDAAVVGEPTDMQPCIAQKGLVKLEVRATGRAGHASRPWEGTNAIYLAARAALKVEEVAAFLAADPPRQNPVLGCATLVATLIAGGTRANVIPPECSFTVDGRSTPQVTNEELVLRVQEAARQAAGDAVRVDVKSSRFVPVHTPESAPVVQSALEALPGSSPRAFGGVSDLYHVRHCPGIILGPGTPPQSHQADEHIERAAVERGAQGYRRLVEAYFARSE